METQTGDLIKKQRKQLTPSQTDRLIAKFNQLFPKGSKALWRSVNRDGVGYQEVTVQHQAYNSYGQAVCFFNEVRSFCSIEPGFIKYPEARGRKVSGNKI